MKTKEKILQVSRQAFNKYGMAKVSLRLISESMGISPGNLTYHFKKKEEIEEALYFELVSVFDREFQEMESDSLEIKDPFEFIGQIFDVVYEYRFFFLDFSQFMRKNPTLFQHYQELSLFRKAQFSKTIELMQSRGMIRKEELLGEYEILFTRIQTITDFYLASKTDEELKDPSGLKLEFLKLFQYAFYPYLSELAKSEMFAKKEE